MSPDVPISPRFTVRQALDALRAAALSENLYAADGRRLDGAAAHRLLDTVITGVTADSRRVGPGSLFAAVRGAHADGHLFVDKAVHSGASVVLFETDAPSIHAMFREGQAVGVVLVKVVSTRAALAVVAAAAYGHPAAGLTLVGTTGTNGKTTVTYLAHHLLTRLRGLTGLIGTVENRIGDQVLPATHTTPDPVALSALFRQMADAGCRACAMEVSSHALDQDRVRGHRFAVGVFTNLTLDHLDYHGTFDAYAAAKKRLFDALDAEAAAVLNADDPHGRAMGADTRARVLTYGTAPAADIRVAIRQNALDGLRLHLDGHDRRFRLVGGFNALNLAAAYGVGRALGYGAAETLDALADAPPVPGRFESFAAPDGVLAIVDYAHTPDALENVLATTRPLLPPGGRLTCVFGCGGDRDRSKRPLMGALAERYADRVVVTDDNPRTEDPAAIRAEIVAGMQRPEAATVLPDRAAAIAWALREAAPGDAVLVAGKGHETYQILGTTRTHFDDREEVRRSFDARAGQPA